MKKILNKLIIILLAIITYSADSIYAQCGTSNIPFQSGEQLSYDLYIKLGFATTKGGFANLRTQSTTYKGTKAYKMDLISETQGLARKLFSLNDTLTAYTDVNLRPLAYLKDAHEGGDYTKERLIYNYNNDASIMINSVRHKNGEFKFDEKIVAPGCTYDLVSILFYCRTIDYANMKIGEEKNVNFISGQKRGNMRIVYNGKETIKANDGKKYNTLKLTLYVADKAFDNGKEAMKVNLSDDNNKIPISLETKLKVGSTKAILKSYNGYL